MTAFEVWSLSISVHLSYFASLDPSGNDPSPKSKVVHETKFSLKISYWPRLFSWVGQAPDWKQLSFLQKLFWNPSMCKNLVKAHLHTATAISGGSRISQRGCANPKGGAPTYLPNFSQKLHENEEILAERGGGHASLAPPLDPPLAMPLQNRSDVTLESVTEQSTSDK